MLKKIKLLVAMLLLCGLVSGSLRAFAIDASKMKSMMTISPPRQKMILVPGEVYEGEVEVANSSSAERDLEYSVRVGSFGLREDENGDTDYNYTDIDTVTSYNQMMNWISFAKETGKVAPGDIDTVSYSIDVPKDAPAGGQYASIVIRNDTKKDNNSGNMAIENVVEFAVGLFAEVAGETRDEGLILENDIPSFLLNNPLTASSTVKNNGNVHTDAEYILQVWPLFSDEEVCTNEEEPDTSMIMPETERYHAQTCNLPSMGIFKAKQTVKIFGETSIIERTIIACPLWVLFLILFVIIAIAIWIVMKVRGNKKRGQSRSND